MNRFCGKNTEVLNVKAGDAYKLPRYFEELKHNEHFQCSGIPTLLSSLYRIFHV
jgi:hypothetical protein